MAKKFKAVVIVRTGVVEVTCLDTQRIRFLVGQTPINQIVEKAKHFADGYTMAVNDCRAFIKKTASEMGR